MNRNRFVLLITLLLAGTAAFAQVDPSRFAEMRWRMIGPFRGSRTVAAAGVPSQPGVFYMGAVNGGVWKTDNYGRTWTPIFDEHASSIGAIAVAPSDPKVVYVGSGEGLQRPDLSTGDGIYRSADAGATWTHLGLRDGQRIPMIAVDPQNANRLFVAVLGHPYGANAERGVFRSTDGGKTFDKVLYRDAYTGGADVAIDPKNPQTVYATLWQSQQKPWEGSSATGAFQGPGSGIYKSTDGGTTWRQLTKGLPATGELLLRAGIEVAPANPNRLYAILGSSTTSGGSLAATSGSLYRSDDAGESWQLINNQSNLWQRPNDFARQVRTDPKNADVVYIANVTAWKSTDGGKTFAAFRGAPGGDDYQAIWINPSDPNIILLTADQGAIVTLNGGKSWSSWYNQPTAQLYNVSTDNAFPYRVCGGQQESGDLCINSRSDDGRITFHDWHPTAPEEYGYVVPDPLDPDTLFCSKVYRYDRRTGQAQDVTPKPLQEPPYLVRRTQPLAFSPVDPHILYFASNTLWKTTTGGNSWTQISPDLSRKTWAVPPSVGVYSASVTPRQMGVIYAIAPSPLDVNRIWAGTDDGTIHLTTDGGKTWKDVTPSALVPWAKVSIIEASHFDANTAYAAINTFRLDQLQPHIYRTRDGGQSWTEIVSGIANGATTNVVREDPKTKGLLFAGNETEVWVSFDDGDHWQSLRLNMPRSSMRDLAVHGDDLIVASHGRGFWILDDIEPLRQIRSSAVLLQPQNAIRFRCCKWLNMPLPPDEPAGQNPPDGAIIDYVLPSNASNVALEIVDGSGAPVRRYTSADAEQQPAHECSESQTVDDVPWYWIRPPVRLAATAGMHRWVWDLRYTPIPPATYSLTGVPCDTPPDATAPWVLPGTYTVRLTVDGKTYTQPLVVRMDPRVTTPREGLQLQFDLSLKLYRWTQDLNAAIAKLPPTDPRVANLTSLLGSVTTLFGILQSALFSADVTPTEQAVATFKQLEGQVPAALRP